MQLASVDTPVNRIILAAALITAALLLQQFANFPYDNAFTNSLSNWMHVPMFAAITAALLWLRPQQSIGLTIAVIVLLACLSEGVQLLTNRQASLADLLRDGLGAAIALVLLRKPEPRRIAAALTLTAVLTLAVPSIYLFAYDHQRRSFPVLYTPDAIGSRILTSVQSGTGLPYTVTHSHPWQPYADTPVLEVLWGDTRWPGIHFAEPISNWRDYSHLVVDVFNPHDVSQPLTAGVRHRGFEGTARYYPTQLSPGHNRLRIGLQHLAFLHNGEPAVITHLMLYTTQQHAGQRILLGRVWLE